VPLLPSVYLVFGNLAGDKALKDVSEQSRLVQLALRFNTQKVAEQAGVGKVYLGGFNQAFTEVLIKRRYQYNLSGCFKDAQPLGNGRYGHAQGHCQIRFVEDAPATGGQERQRAAKLA
jgi:hypothetical protein